MYNEPTAEVISFEASDVITTSGGGQTGGGIVLPPDEEGFE